MDIDILHLMFPKSKLKAKTKAVLRIVSSDKVISFQQIDESARFLHHLNQELGLSVGLYLCLVAFRAITAACSLFSTIKQYELSGVSFSVT